MKDHKSIVMLKWDKKCELCRGGSTGWCHITEIISIPTYVGGAWSLPRVRVQFLEGLIGHGGSQFISWSELPR